MSTPIHARCIYKGKFVFLLALILVSELSIAQSNTPDEISWYANYNGNAVAYYNDTIFAGGRFSIIGKPSGKTLIIDPKTGTPQKRDIALSTATVCIPDGEGGWFAAMEYAKGGSVIQHIFETGDIDYNWQAFAISGQVNAMALYGCRLFVGGGFWTIDGYGSPFLSALDAATSEVLDWRINYLPLSGSTIAPINTLAVVGSKLFIGGTFRGIKGFMRNFLVAVDPITGELSSWNPSPNGAVSKLLACKTGLYVAGDFTHIGDAPRVHLACIDPYTGKATRWNPNPNGAIESISETRGVIYAQGAFTTIGGQLREGVAALNAFSGLATDWKLAPLPTGSNRYLCDAKNGVVYVAEAYAIENTQISTLSAFDPRDGGQPLWQQSMDEKISTLEISGNQSLISGKFNGYGGSLRTGLAALDVNTGAVRDWKWTFNKNFLINHLFPIGNTLYINGHYLTSINNMPCIHFAAVNMDTGEVLTGQPSVDDGDKKNVNTVCRVGNTLYMGGEFTRINGQLRNCIGAVDMTTGELTPWNPNTNGTVYSIIANGNTLYIGGGFTEIGGYTRNGLAAYDLTTGQLLPWAPAGNYDYIEDMKFYNNNLYVGAFNSKLDAVNPRTGMCHPLFTDFSGAIDNLVITGQTLYAGWRINRIDGQSRQGMAAIDLSTGQVLPWNPDVQSRCLAPIPNGVCVWGNRFDHDRQEIMMFRNASSAQAVYHSADSDRDGVISATEIGRVVGFYAAEGYHVDEGTEDGFAPGAGEKGGVSHDSDFQPADGMISPQELNRLITFYNAGGYVADDSTRRFT